MSILVSCHACGKELRAKDEAAGKKAKCPTCKAIFQIPLPTMPRSTRKSTEDTLPSPPLDNFGDARQPCPACGESIASAARKCRYCDEVLIDSPPKRKKSSRSSGSSQYRQGKYPTADLGKRFLGAMADVFVGLLCLGPGGGMIIAAGLELNAPLAMIGVVLLGLGGLAHLGLQIYLLVTRSQTIGKWLVNTQILDYETHEPASFVKTFLLRVGVNVLIGFVPFLGWIYPLVDIGFIFGEEHRCLHDQIAGTYVVDIS